jgi:hypothetical protein
VAEAEYLACAEPGQGLAAEWSQEPFARAFLAVRTSPRP